MREHISQTMQVQILPPPLILKINKYMDDTNTNQKPAVKYKVGYVNQDGLIKFENKNDYFSIVGDIFDTMEEAAAAVFKNKEHYAQLVILPIAHWDNK